MSEAGLASLCVVVPCFNEEAVIGAFHARLMAALDALPVAAQVLYVDDGSRDRTAAAMAALAGSRIIATAFLACQRCGGRIADHSSAHARPPARSLRERSGSQACAR